MQRAAREGGQLTVLEWADRGGWVVADLFQLRGSGRYLCISLLAVAAALAAACGGGGGGGGGSSTTIFVSVAPAAANVATNASQQFTATVTGTTNTQVTWSVAGAGCSGAACGTITAAGLYTAPGAVPNPATVTVTATSVANSSRTGSATVTVVLAGAPVIGTLRPSSLRAGQAAGPVLRVVGQNFIAGTTVIFDGSQRAAACPTLAECTIELSAADLALPRNVAVQARQPDGTLSNAVSFVIVAADLTEGVIELTSANSPVDVGTLAVLDPSNMGEVSPAPPQLNVTQIGLSPSGTCTESVRGGQVKILRPAVVFLCLAGSGLSVTHTYAISGPTPDDILLSAPAQANGRILLTLTVPADAQPGPRTIFVTNARGDIAAMAGGIDIQ